MDINVIWKAMLMVFIGFLFLRFVGRKSVSQMTIATTVVLISVGSIIIQPVVNQSVWNTVIATGVFIAFLIVTEYLTMKFNVLEKLITGKSKVVIKNGEIDINTLKKMRLTSDKLEMHLRQKGVKQISDVKVATMEANGQLGYELKPDAEPLTVGEFKKLMAQLGYTFPQQQQASSQQQTGHLFEELKQKSDEVHNPKQLH
ncbi:DUF421 domain-containing protein [Gracilibacillus sp. YIM 98692]|uniref:DUF421 domain-containing protein n=1 Tax=Gracilibacillus sp. YIM 98692 TaxID=2663532 RepID=UPI001F088A6B|nr:DUF421 domain-containing protein [Gracilibacillus sp. YIM 98692]